MYFAARIIRAILYEEYLYGCVMSDARKVAFHSGRVGRKVMSSWSDGSNCRALCSGLDWNAPVHEKSSFSCCTSSSCAFALLLNTDDPVFLRRFGACCNCCGTVRGIGGNQPLRNCVDRSDPLRYGGGVRCSPPHPKQQTAVLLFILYCTKWNNIVVPCVGRWRSLDFP